MDPRIVDSIQVLVDHYKNEMVEFVQELARIESPSTIPGSQVAIISLLMQNLTKLGYKNTRVTGISTGGYLYARPENRERSKPIQLLVGHCDTVWPLKTLENMPVAVDDGIIRGPGVYDMKGGLTQMIYALKVLDKIDQCPVVTPVVLINSDEEIGSKESTGIIKRIAKIADRAFILEPSLGLSGKIKTRRKGGGRFTIKVTGKSAHAGLDPGQGTNAIVALSFIIQELFKMNDPEREISVNVGMVEGGTRPNVVAADSRAVVDVRVPTQEDATYITDRIHHLKYSQPQVDVEIEGYIGRPPMEATAQNSRLWKNATKAGELLGIELTQGFAGGASDGNTTSQYTATLDGLGATGDGAHAAHEFMYIDKMTERTALLAMLLLMDPIGKSQL